MRKIIIILLLFFITLPLMGAEDTWATQLSGYKPLYILTGAGEDQVKIRFSFKFDIFSPYKIGLYFAYSQLLFWDLYEFSSPFTEINFNPDFFWRFQSGDNFANDYVIPFIDYFQVGLWEHISNGMPDTGDENSLSRGLDRQYLQFQASVGSWIKFGLNFKYFYVHYITYNNEPHDNPDIQDYIGSFIARPFIIYYNKELDDTLELYGEFGAGGGANGLDFTNGGFLEIGFKSYKLFSRFRLYAQYYQGYFESILNYDRSAENIIIENGGEETVLPFSFRVGIIFE
ncbi:MAG: phospholipase A [Spirochaetales bacterium]|nr:phospholipase A [Spirochaetales bacterium]